MPTRLRREEVTFGCGHVIATIESTMIKYWCSEQYPCACVNDPETTNLHYIALAMADEFLTAPKPPPDLKIPSSTKTVKVSCIDRYDNKLINVLSNTEIQQHISFPTGKVVFPAARLHRSTQFMRPIILVPDRTPVFQAHLVRSRNSERLGEIAFLREIRSSELVHQCRERCCNNPQRSQCRC